MKNIIGIVRPNKPIKDKYSNSLGIFLLIALTNNRLPTTKQRVEKNLGPKIINSVEFKINPGIAEKKLKIQKITPYPYSVIPIKSLKLSNFRVSNLLKMTFRKAMSSISLNSTV